MSKKIVLSLVLVLLFFILGALWLTSRLSPILGFDIKSEDKLVAGEIIDQKIRETFLGHTNGLRRIHLTADTFQRKNTGKLIARVLSLENKHEEIIQEKEFEDSEIQRKNVLVLEFSPILDSSGKKFLIEVSAKNSTPGNAFTVWRSSTDVYKEGKLYYNDALQDGDLLFNAYYQLPESYLTIFWTSLKEKLAGDPAFFTIYSLLVLGNLFLLMRLLFL